MMGGPHVTNGQENEEVDQIRFHLVVVGCFEKSELFSAVRFDDFLEVSLY